MPIFNPILVGGGVGQIAVSSVVPSVATVYNTDLHGFQAAPVSLPFSPLLVLKNTSILLSAPDVQAFGDTGYIENARLVSGNASYGGISVYELKSTYSKITISGFAEELPDIEL